MNGPEAGFKHALPSKGISSQGLELFGGSLEEVEGLRGFGGDGVGGLFEVVRDFEDAGGIGGKGCYVFGCVLPVDGAVCGGAGVGPTMLVLVTVVVVEVELGYAGLEEFEGFVDAFVVFGGGQVRVAYVEADAYAIEVAYADDFEEMLGGGDFVLEIFKEDADAEGVGEGLEVFDGGEGVFEGAGVPVVVFIAEVESAGGNGDLLCGFEGALDLVHGGDAAGLFRIDEI